MTASSFMGNWGDRPGQEHRLGAPSASATRWRGAFLAPRPRMRGVLGACAVALAVVVVLGASACGGSGSPETITSVIAVSISPTSLQLVPGQSQPLAATVTGSSTTAVTWTSSNVAVARVDASGMVAAVAVGTATITATSNADPSRAAAAVVSVVAPVSGVPRATSPGVTFGWTAPAYHVTLSGMVTPNGLQTFAWFEYSSTPSFAIRARSSTTVVEAGSASPTPVSARLDGMFGAMTTYLRLVAQNSAGADTSASIIPQPPQAPFNMTAVVNDEERITVSWQHDPNVLRGFVLLRRDLNTGTVTPIHPRGSSDPVVPPDWRSVVDDSYDVQSTHTWIYIASTCNAAGCSADTAQVTAPRLEPPTQLTTTPVGPTAATLTWRDNSITESGFLVERRTTSTDEWSEVSRTSRNVTSYAATGLTAGARYFYRVSAFVNPAPTSIPNTVGSTATRTSLPSADVIVVP